MEKLLFTGGTGFLGKNVMPLLKTQYDVTTCGITPDDMIKVNLAKEVPALSIACLREGAYVTQNRNRETGIL